MNLLKTFCAMNKKLLIFPVIISVFLGFMGCEEKWNEYYNDYPETVNKKLWDEMKNDDRVSDFVQLLTENSYDTLFTSDISYTLFIPGNEALNAYLGENEITDYFIGYHISPLFVQSGNISSDTRLVQTLSEKYIQFSQGSNSILLDGVPIEFESPLYLDGKYYILQDVIKPLPSLYEFFKTSNPILSNYIDSQDSVILDRELSVPVGFDEFGNTVYDTVSDVINIFELEYFPVKQEDRKLSATFVFPKAETYNQALNVVADALGSSIVDYRDIPLEWQYDELMPFLFEKGLFLNRIEPEYFEMRSPGDSARLMNVLGDSVTIDYIPVEKTLCSNGYAYNYQDFVIPENLYLGSTRFETEQLLVQSGINRFGWDEDVIVQADISVLPKKIFISSASNDSIIRVDFPLGYEGNYSVSFKGPRLFPRRYLMVVGTNMDIGGIYDIYVNDELAGTFDYYDFFLNRGIIFGVNGDRYLPDGRFNRFDMFVENITSYDEVNIRFEYQGPGNVPNNGLVIDYLEFVPVVN